jgi:hypothetical protein
MNNHRKPALFATSVVFMTPTGIFGHLKQSKDPCVLRELQKYLRCSAKLAELRTRVRFLYQCIERKQFPKHYWKSLRRNRINPTATALTRHAKNESDTVFEAIVEMERKRAQCEGALDKLSVQERQEFEGYVRLILAQRVNAREKKLASQLNPVTPCTKFPTNPERYVHNFSSLTLDKLLLEALSLGPKFCCPRRNISQIDLEVQFESLYDQLTELVPTSELNVEQLKSTLVTSCYQYLKYKPRFKHLLTKEHLDALKRLRDNDSIIVCKPDKGAGIVLMDRTDYTSKMEVILSDNSKFQKMEREKDKTKPIEKAISKVLCQMKMKGIIDASTFERLHPTGTTIPRLYGLPKVHKPGVPLRPILDMFNSPYHSLAKWLVSLLEPIRKELAPHSLKDTFQFIESIKDLKLDGRQMYSLDVVSLFTNVPLRETIDYICEFIEQSGKDIRIPVTDLRTLLLLCTQNVQFLFNNKIYRQKDGVAMGSPLGPLLADIFMGKLETQCLNTTIKELTSYHRYVDDIFIISSNDIDSTDILSKFNSAHPNIAFTVEREQNGSLNFLDADLLRRTDNSIQRKVYRKPTWTGQYIHFDSFVPLNQKRNLIRCLTERATKICSNDCLQDELDFLKHTFTLNGYPERFILKTMQSIRKAPKIQTAGKKRVYISLPFRGDSISEVITRKLKCSIETTFMAANLCLSFSSSPAISFQLKDRLPKSTTSFCIYSFVCSCRASYVGRTTRYLSDRMREHTPAWLSQGLIKSTPSAVALHLAETGHVTNNNNAFQVIFRVTPNRSRAVRLRLLSIAEAIAIRLHKPNLCIQKKLVRPLNLCWPTNSYPPSPQT